MREAKVLSQIAVDTDAGLQSAVFHGLKSSEPYDKDFGFGTCLHFYVLWTLGNFIPPNTLLLTDEKFFNFYK